MTVETMVTTTVLTMANNITNGSSTVVNKHKEYEHFLYIIANVFFIVAFLAFSSWRYYAIHVRSFMAFGNLAVVIWAGFYSCHLDYLLWSLMMLVLNVVYSVYFFCRSMPKKMDARLQELYDKLFKPLHVSRLLFADLSACGEVIEFSSDANYAVEQVTPCGEHLAVLISGRFTVSHDNCLLHSVKANQILDSPEYEASQCDNEMKQNYYQVTITSTEKSTILRWNLDILKSYLDTTPLMATVLSSLMGKDITQKMYKIQEKLIRDKKLRRRPSYQPSMKMIDIRNNLMSSPSSVCSSLEDVERFFRSEPDTKQKAASTCTVQSSQASHPGSIRSKSPTIIRVFAPDEEPLAAQYKIVATTGIGHTEEL